MILTCPECSTRYQAKDAAFLPAGRRVRCAKCGHSWHQHPPVAEAEPQAEAPPAPPTPEPEEPAAAEPEAPEPPPEPEPSPAKAEDATEAAEPPEPAEAVPQEPARSINRLAVAGGWLGLVVVILVIGWAAVSYRQQVATLWPQSATLYSALGLPVNARGIAFTDVSYHRETEDKQSVLAVTGKLVNISSRELAVPPVRVTLSDAKGRELYHWDFTPDVAVLRAGQSVGFLTRLSSPPDAARHLKLEFAGKKG